MGDETDLCLFSKLKRGSTFVPEVPFSNYLKNVDSKNVQFGSLLKAIYKKNGHSYLKSV